MEYQQPHDKTITYKVPCKLCEVVVTDILPIKNKTLLCIVNCYIKFLIVKKADGLLADNLIRAAKSLFANLDFPQIIVLDASTNFVSDKLKKN